MKKHIRRLVSVACAAVISAGAIGMFAACTSNEPEVTITYEFNGRDYDVRYKLSRSDAPKTVQHFIDLADAGYYDGTCIHDYTGSILYGGGYYYDEETKELTEKDYFTVVRELEKAGHTFEQTVFYQNGENRTPLYTVYGEFPGNGVGNEGDRRVNVHSKGALVMYYTDKSKSAERIDVLGQRNDGGKQNDGVSEQEVPYATNSATSLFYTYLGTSDTAADKKYAVFGRTIAYQEELQPLLDAIADLTAEDDENTPDIDESVFTKEVTMTLDMLDHPASVDIFSDIASVFESVRKGGNTATFHVPTEPIIIKTVKVTKY